MKISSKNLDKILECCTKKEIDLIIYIGQFQDDFGIIKGVHYKDVLEAINIAKSTFYKLLYGLESKDIIEICWLNEDFSYWSVTIKDNVFDSSKAATRDKGEDKGGHKGKGERVDARDKNSQNGDFQSDDYKKGYFKLNYAILHTPAFKSMTKSEKVIVIRLLKIADFNYNQIRITTRTLMEWTGKSMRSVKKFLETLRGIFGISHPVLNIHNGQALQKIRSIQGTHRRQDDLMSRSRSQNQDTSVNLNSNLIIISKSHGFETRSTSERDIRNRHLIDFVLRKSKAEATEKDIKDGITVFKQYKVNTANVMLTLLDKTIGQFGTLAPAYLNKLTQSFVR